MSPYGITSSQWVNTYDFQAMILFDTSHSDVLIPIHKLFNYHDLYDNLSPIVYHD